MAQKIRHNFLGCKNTGSAAKGRVNSEPNNQQPETTQLLTREALVNTEF